MAKESNASLGADLVIPGLALAFAIYFFVDIRDLAWEAKANGVLIGTILVALIAVQGVRLGLQLARGEGRLGFDTLLGPREMLPARLALVGVTVAFIVGVQWLGLTLALFLAMAAALRAVGLKSWKKNLLISLVVAASAYGLFIALLDTEMPHGPVEQLLSKIK
ncbi:MAG TPA: tripartite tricarboxylate transporter TctB family protein [Burkholderiales bacterium]|nr:tripartite tricarboxylate transporter TctB family protein [Burkholderiales bacterium]